MISHISTSDSDGGSAISANRIHENLINRGYDSFLFVGNSKIKKKYTRYLTYLPWLRKIDRLVDIIFSKFGFQYSFIPSNLFLNTEITYSPIIQLYNIHGGYFQFSKLLKLSRYSKIIWRLSDYWAMTGHCAYPGICENWKTICANCPDLQSYPAIGIDNTKEIWIKKKKIINEIDMQIVVPTKKLFFQVKESPILKNKKVHLIPNGVDTFFFKPFKKKISRSKLKIPNRFSILFISHVAHNNFRKGTHILFKIINKLKNNNNIQFIIAGIDSHKWNEYGFKNLVIFDYDMDLEWKRFLYNSSDIILIPSVNENLPNVLLEAMSCGIPSISNDSGGINECVNESNGILIKDMNVNKFVSEIIRLSKNKEELKNLKKNARKTIAKNFSVDKEIDTYIKIYEDIRKNKL